MYLPRHLRALCSADIMHGKIAAFEQVHRLRNIVRHYLKYSKAFYIQNIPYLSFKLQRRYLPVDYDPVHIIIGYLQIAPPYLHRYR